MDIITKKIELQLNNLFAFMNNNKSLYFLVFHMFFKQEYFHHIMILYEEFKEN